MAVPAVKKFFRPILEIAAEVGDIFPYKQLIEELTARLSLTEDDLAELIPSRAQTKVKTRIYVAAYHLKRANLISTEGGIKITPQGRAFLANHQGDIESADLTHLTAEFGENSELAEPIPDDSGELVPDEQIAQSHQQHQEILADEILSHLKGISPASFERLVNELLREMGYGTIEQDQGFIGDHGVDGILNQDTLGLEKIYVQAKRWDNTPVGEPDISRFSGSLDLKGATKGVFITTSTFSAAAKAYIQNNRSGKSIRLIDGRELAELMIRHGVGVVTEITYEVKKLDANYFAEV